EFIAFSDSGLRADRIDGKTNPLPSDRSHTSWMIASAWVESGGIMLATHLHALGWNAPKALWKNHFGSAHESNIAGTCHRKSKKQQGSANGRPAIILLDRTHESTERPLISDRRSVPYYRVQKGSPQCKRWVIGRPQCPDCQSKHPGDRASQLASGFATS